MTKAAFKKAMVRGLGRCVIELEENDDIEKYRDIVLWGCLHNLSYDTQCEGTRSKYIYVLQSKFKDDYFEPKIIEMFMKEKMDPWVFNHFANMLYLFACDGSEKSRHYLYVKYDKMLNNLIVNKRYLESSEGINQSEDIRLFHDTVKGNDTKNHNRIREKITVNDVVEASKDEWFKCRGKIVRFSYNASEEELLELARILVNEPQEQMKANLLCAFRKSGFPLETGIIVDYTKSGNENIKQAAFEILAITKDKFVREYALELIKDKIHVERALSMLFRNYQEKDANLIFSILKQIKVKYSDGLWHGVYSDAISWLENDRKVPEDIIIFLYENTICSCCREYIVNVMSKRGILKDNLLKECLHDSKQEIRKFAERKYRRANKSKLHLL